MLTIFPSRTVALEVFGFSVHWYGIMYLLAFVLSALLIPRLQRERHLSLTRDEWMTILSWGVLGVIMGGRLGYVLFYQPSYFAEHPLEVVAVWNGGMSFHGGLLGVAVAIAYACWRRNISLLRVADIVVVPAALGLALGRFGNFINQELYGTVTSLPWGIEIPGVSGLRHPTQLYAVGKDLLIAAICFGHLRSARAQPGQTAALFFILYGIGRFLIEFLREQEYPLTQVLGLSFTRGQLLSTPMVVFGVVLWIWLNRARIFSRGRASISSVTAGKDSRSDG